MVALNFQNNDEAMMLCHGKFLDNGGCGYVLKPNYLIQPERSAFNPCNPSNSSNSRILSIRIISGQFLSKIDEKSSDIPDPYVSVSIHGVRSDSNKFQTKVIRNNGFDPLWNETFQFRVNFPELALISFSVFDHDDFSGDDHLGSFCLPMTLIQTGQEKRNDSNDVLFFFFRLSTHSPASSEQRQNSFDFVCSCHNDWWRFAKNYFDSTLKTKKNTKKSFSFRQKSALPFERDRDVFSDIRLQRC